MLVREGVEKGGGGDRRDLRRAGFEKGRVEKGGF